MHEDHLWLLQTDPAYTRRYIPHVLAGQFGQILTKNFKDVMAGSKLMRDATIYWSWEGILEEVQKVRDVHLKFKSVIHADESLPEPYERALASLEALLIYQIQYRSKYIQRILPFRPGFHQYFEFINIPHLHSTAVLPIRQDNATSIFEVFFKDKLDWCLRTLAGENTDYVEEWIPDATPRHNHAMIFAVLDEHLTQCLKEGRKEEVARLDEVLYSEYSDLAAVHQMLDMVGLHRPPRNWDFRDKQRLALCQEALLRSRPIEENEGWTRWSVAR